MRKSAVNGLVLKDWQNSSKSLNTVLLLGVVYLAIGIITDMSFLYSVLVFILGSQIYSAFSYDAMSGGNKYAMTLNVTRKEVVDGRYSFGLLTIFVGGGISTLLVLIHSMLYGLEYDIAIVGVMLIFITMSVSLLYQAVSIPILYKYGVEKTRILMFLLVFIPIAGYSGLMGLQMSADLTTISLGAISSLPLCLLAHYFSRKLSRKVMEGVDVG